MTVAKRLTTGTALVLVLAVLILVARTEQSLRQALRDDVFATLTSEAVLVGVTLPNARAEWQHAVRTHSAISGNRVTLIDRSGTVLADSDFPDGPLPPLENHAERAEVRSALAGDTGRAIRFSATVGRDLLYVAVPGGPGVVRVARDESRADVVLGRVRRGMLLAAVLALAIGVAAAWLAARSVARPLVTLASAAAAMATGAPPRFPRSGIVEIDRLVQSLRDMHRQLQERFAELVSERAESTALVEAMVEGVIAADARGRVTTANHAAHRLLGYADDAPLPDLSTLFRAKGARELVAAAIEHRGERSATIELDGQILLLTARGLPDGSAVLVLHDLTETRRLETVRRDFVANVSHELKTPLTSISGYAETLLGEQTDEEMTRRFHGIILANARRMHRLVDDLLDLSRIESGHWQPTLDQISADAIAREVAAMSQERARDGGIQLTVDVPAGLGMYADADALRQILTNLVDNGIRHTPAGGTISIAATRDDGAVCVTVSDTGAGIGSEHLPRIFERFYRVDASRSRAEGGTGLGLSIVRHLVESHGGELAAESELGRGTTIRMTFPENRA